MIDLGDIPLDLRLASGASMQPEIYLQGPFAHAVWRRCLPPTWQTIRRRMPWLTETLICRLQPRGIGLWSKMDPPALLKLLAKGTV